MARPVPFNLADVAKIVTKYIGKATIGVKEFLILKRYSEKGKNKQAKNAQRTLKKKAEKLIKKIGQECSPFLISPFEFAEVNPVAAWKEAIQQLSLIELGDWRILKDGLDEKDESLKDKMLLNMSTLIAVDPAALDRRLGICSIPLYDFLPEQVDIFHSGRNLDEVKQILKSKDIFQYFFPAPDQLALGLAEKQKPTIEVLIDHLNKVPELGHPFGETEIVTINENIEGIIQSLQALGLVVEGEAGLRNPAETCH